MKVTNVSNTTIYLRDLRFNPQAQTEGRRGEDRYIAAGASFYLPNTSQVLRSAIEGDLRAWRDADGNNTPSGLDSTPGELNCAVLPGALTIDSTGGGGAHANMQPFAVVNFIVKT